MNPQLKPLTQAEFHLQTLRHEWFNALRIMEMVRRDIDEHPEWGIVLGAYGPEPRTSNQRAPTTPLRRVGDFVPINHHEHSKTSA
jgi:hypothetical protein